MIELVHILRTIVETVCGGVRQCDVPPIRFSQLGQLVFDELWEKRRVAIYSTAWEMKKDLENLAVLGVIKYKSGEIRIENPNRFLEETTPFVIVTRNMVAGNAYLKHVLQLIEDGARRYATENISVLQPA